MKTLPFAHPRGSAMTHSAFSLGLLVLVLLTLFASVGWHGSSSR